MVNVSSFAANLWHLRLQDKIWKKDFKVIRKKSLGCFCAQITFPVERRGEENMLRDIYRPTFGQHIQWEASGGKLGKGR